MMNERIKELAEQAGMVKFPPSIETELQKNILFGDGQIEKFAELIVRECIGCCEQVISDPVPKSVDTFEQGGIHCMDEIKQHFGVGMSTEDKKTLIKELLGVKND
jgi:hypothetical protein